MLCATWDVHATLASGSPTPASPLHTEGSVKLLADALQAEIIKDPARFVEKDPLMARTLLDQREAVCA